MAPRWQLQNIHWQESKRYVEVVVVLLYLARNQKWWRRFYIKIILFSFAVLEWEGVSLELTRISRLDMGAYLCIATNGVPPSVSKRIKVSVDCEYFGMRIWRVESTILKCSSQFLPFIIVPPMLQIPHQLIGVPMYHNVTIECMIEAHPTSLNYWTRNNDSMIHDSAKFKWVRKVERVRKWNMGTLLNTSCIHLFDTNFCPGLRRWAQWRRTNRLCD